MTQSLIERQRYAVTFQSKLSQEKRAELADLVIAETKTVPEVSIEYEVSRKTVNGWVQKRKRQLGIPGSPIGGDRTLPLPPCVASPGRNWGGSRPNGARSPTETSWRTPRPSLSG